MNPRRGWVRAGATCLLVLAIAGLAVAAPRIKVVGEKEATGEVWKAYAQVKQAVGIVPHGVQIMSLSPALLALQQSYAQGLVATDHALPARLKHMAGVVVGAALGCDNVRVTEEYELRKLGVKADQIQRLEQDMQSAGLSQREVTALKYVRKLSLTPADVNDQDFADLRWDGLGDAEILELTVVAGYFDGLARVMRSLGVEPDEYPAPTQ